MDIELLEAIGNTLYGDQWQTNLARSLDIDSRRVRQWINKERPIPDWLAKECKILLEKNKLECEELIKKLS
ncbi:helix-turn-helix domain-containing protein [Psychrobacter sp. I-STPA10]|uniref:helix-turn-helix domain-containing protein n=1 Tax=Psychrobacter sp. I-STPA10 TaxID=2585769 RepID=UPI001E560F18|nr:helix-turn-helix domain-containing protein [Psychrobacter sp. I-STPA10]